MANVSIEGGCLCGAVRYRASAAPTTSMLCHCRSCRRATGASPVAWVTFARDAFAIVHGNAARHASSPRVMREHCARCSTQLTWATADAPDIIDITTCSLDDANAFPPTYHAWLEHSPTWLKFDDGLPGYPRSRAESEGNNA